MITPEVLFESVGQGVYESRLATDLNLKVVAGNPCQLECRQLGDGIPQADNIPVRPPSPIDH